MEELHVDMPYRDDDPTPGAAYLLQRRPTPMDSERDASRVRATKYMGERTWEFSRRMGSDVIQSSILKKNASLV
jgi:hypothetical protein